MTHSMSIDNFITAFDRNREMLFHQPRQWLNSFRKEGFDHFCKIGLPDRSNEEWKYTSVEMLSQIPYSLSDLVADESLGSISNYIQSNIVIVFVNGRYSQFFSSFDEKNSEYHLKAFSCMSEQDCLMPSLYSTATKPDFFVSLHKAFATDGVYLHISDNAVISNPIHILHINTDDNSQLPLMHHPHVYIYGGMHSKFSIIETYHSIHSKNSLVNSLCEFIVDENAHASHYLMFNEDMHTAHIHNNYVIQKKNSSYRSQMFSLSSKLLRNALSVKLSQDGANVSLDGLYLIHKNHHSDNHTIISHQKSCTSSNQVYKGILNDHARGVFHGKIEVLRQAQKVEAHQLNNNLLLNRSAEIDTKPELTIDANDIICTHGATVGQLDSDELFYLESRGIPPALAQAMLTKGFAAEILEKIEPTLFKNFCYQILSCFSQQEDVQCL